MKPNESRVATRTGTRPPHPLHPFPCPYSMVTQRVPVLMVNVHQEKELWYKHVSMPEKDTRGYRPGAAFTRAARRSRVRFWRAGTGERACRPSLVSLIEYQFFNRMQK